MSGDKLYKKKGVFYSIKENWQLHLFIFIPLVLVMLFSYVPMFGIQLAFKKFDPNLGIWGSSWIGFKNFIKFFGSYQFTRVIGNTVLISLYGLIASFPVPIILALMLNALTMEKYKKVVQTVTYIPHFISTVVMVGLLMQIFNSKVGIFGIAYSAFTGGTAPDLIASSDAFPHIYVWSGIWQSMGWSSIVYIAALAGVDKELHEAAQIDGAGRFKRVIHIDFPSIMPTAIMLLILSCGSLMNVGFEKIFLMQNDLNLRMSEVISTYVYKVGLFSSTNDYGYATAIGLFNSIINFVLIMIVNTVSKKLSEQSLW